MNLDIGLPVELLRQPLRQCFSGESKLERLAITATNRRGRTIQLQVSCAPFKLGDNSNWGAIVMMEEKT